MSQQVFFRDSDGIIGSGHLVNGKPVRITFEHGARSFYGVDKRVTSSSRLPGKAIVGVVDHSGGSKLTLCPKCQGLRHDLGGPHAPQIHRDGSVTDCAGDVVRPAHAEAA